MKNILKKAVLFSVLTFLVGNTQNLHSAYAPSWTKINFDSLKGGTTEDIESLKSHNDFINRVHVLYNEIDILATEATKLGIYPILEEDIRRIRSELRNYQAIMRQYRTFEDYVQPLSFLTFEIRSLKEMLKIAKKEHEEAIEKPKIKEKLKEKEEKIKNENIYGIAEDQNKRPYMQDYEKIVLEPNKFAFFGIFDGHGDDGGYIAQFVRSNLYKNITNDEDFINDIEKAIKNGFLITSKRLDKFAAWISGTTAVIALIQSKKDKIYIAWVGDSRAIKITKDWKGINLSFDHKPNRADEKKRIEELGGEIRGFPLKVPPYLQNKYFRVYKKTEGGLAISRAFGDELLSPIVTAEPEIISYPFDIENDNYLILGSDGIWDVMTTKDVANFIKEKSKQTLNLNDLARMLLEEAKQKGSGDNLSVIIIDLENLKGAF